jgi:hypothetical protein
MKPISLWIVVLAAGLLLADIFIFAIIYSQFKAPQDWNGLVGESISFDEAVWVSMKNTITSCADATARSTRARATMSAQLGISILSLLVIVLLELEN